MNGIAVVDLGDKFMKVVPTPQVNQEAAPRDPRDASELPEFGQY